MSKTSKKSMPSKLLDKPPAKPAHKSWVRVNQSPPLNQIDQQSKQPTQSTNSRNVHNMHNPYNPHKSWVQVIDRPPTKPLDKKVINQIGKSLINSPDRTLTVARSDSQLNQPNNNQLNNNQPNNNQPNNNQLNNNQSNTGSDKHSNPNTQSDNQSKPSAQPSNCLDTDVITSQLQTMIFINQMTPRMLDLKPLPTHLVQFQKFVECELAKKHYYFSFGPYFQCCSLAHDHGNNFKYMYSPNSYTETDAVIITNLFSVIYKTTYHFLISSNSMTYYVYIVNDHCQTICLTWDEPITSMLY